MRRSLVAGNWKMHGSQEMVAQLLQGLTSGIGAGLEGVDVVVCPPSPYLQLSQSLLQRSAVVLGAQNVHDQPAGAFTGEVAVSMLIDFGVQFVITGHSERRQLFGETDEMVARKFAAIHEQGLTPVLCVGETLAQREEGAAEAVVAAQLDAVFEHNGIAVMKDAVIAYEPVWAIGTGKTASPAQAQQMHSFIREQLARRDAEVAGQTRILYGGSVNADNARELFAQADIDGGLVGGASLKVDEFITICKSVSE